MVVVCSRGFFSFSLFQTAYYYWKYEVKDWAHLRGIETMPQRETIWNAAQIEKRHPGLQVPYLILIPTLTRFTSFTVHFAGPRTFFG